MQGTTESLLLKIEELQSRLEESEQLIEAIKAGEVDAFAINSNNKAEIYTLQSGDYAYRVLIEKFHEGAVNLSEDGLIVYTNTYFSQLVNKDYKNVTGFYFIDLVHPDSRSLFNVLFEQALIESSKGEINLQIENRIIPVYISLISLQPNLPSVGMIVTDLTENKKNEAERKMNERNLALKNEELVSINRQLNESRNFVNNVLESTNHGVLSYQAIREKNTIIDFEIIYVNEIALKQLMLPLDKVKGKRYLTIVPQAKKLGLFDRIVRVLQTGQSETHEINSVYNPDRWFIVHYVPLNDGITTTFIEITDQKKHAQVLLEKNLELERSNAELASFTYIASHDLQEPLRKIKTFSNRILDKEFSNFNPSTKDYFQRIISAATRMQNLIAALLSYSRTNTAENTMAPMDLNVLVEEVKKNIQDAIDENNALIEVAPLPTLVIVAHQFNQLFLNLISNAIKYRKPNVKPVIRISADIVEPEEKPGNAAGKKFWKINVADNGIGFEQQYADRIFELFQRLHAKNEYEGTGIGLAICKKIMQNHNGFISATSKPGVGSIFSIFIPLHSDSI
jgi:signal transduction histidine kinase